MKRSLTCLVVRVPLSMALCPAVALAASGGAQVVPCRATELVSGTNSNGYPSQNCGGGAISADGRFVAFHSRSSNFGYFTAFTDENQTEDVYIHDRQHLLVTRVSFGFYEYDADGPSFYPSLSSDGRYVAFESSATNLIAFDANDQADIFVRDRTLAQTTRVSVDSMGVPGNGASHSASISSDGQLVVFVSDATNLVPGDTNGVADVFLHDRSSGQTTRISVASGGTQSNGASSSPKLSANSRYVAFATSATNLVPSDANGVDDVLLHDRLNGQVSRVSVNGNGDEANGASDSPVISADGRFVAFASSATNLVAGDTNGFSDVFVRDRQLLQTARVSVGEIGQQAEGASGHPAISADGRFVAFESEAYNLVVDKGNLHADIFQRDLETATTRTITTDPQGNPNHYSASRRPDMSADGSAVTFEVPMWITNGWVTGILLRDCDDDFVVTRFCFGDGAGFLCPCAPGSEGGCANSFYPEGGQLLASGVASVGADSIVLETATMSGTTAFYWQGTRWTAYATFDGVRCFDGTMLRIGTKALSVGGISQNPEPGGIPISVRGALPPSGGTRYYQASYRNVMAYCNPSTLNWSNGVKILWIP